MPVQRILVADDDDSYRAHFKRYFEKLGYTVDVAHSYLSVRELLEQHDYALIFSDNAMPISQERQPHPTTGLELMGHAYCDPRHKNTPFVLHTSDESKETQTAVKEMGGVYLHKDGEVSADEVLKPLLKKITPPK